jgi:hypothetical protein
MFLTELHCGRTFRDQQGKIERLILKIHAAFQKRDNLPGLSMWQTLMQAITIESNFFLQDISNSKILPLLQCGKTL